MLCTCNINESPPPLADFLGMHCVAYAVCTPVKIGCSPLFPVCFTLDSKRRRWSWTKTKTKTKGDAGKNGDVTMTGGMCFGSMRLGQTHRASIEDGRWMAATIHIMAQAAQSNRRGDDAWWTEGGGVVTHHTHPLPCALRRETATSRDESKDDGAVTYWWMCLVKP